jgi:hypothetical protein
MVSLHGPIAKINTKLLALKIVPADQLVCKKFRASSTPFDSRSERKIEAQVGIGQK